MRSLSEPLGLRSSSFAQIATFGFGLDRASRMSGVFPMQSIKLMNACLSRKTGDGWKRVGVF
jgi:hypothetical protein